jgi:hypothetical protein
LDAQVQLVKLYSFFGERYEAIKLADSLVAEARKLEKSKIKAKVLYIHILELKKSLVFNDCKKEGDAFITEYADCEDYAWKYLYKT